MELNLKKLKEDKVVSLFFDARVNRTLFFAGFILCLLWKFHCITAMSLPEGSRIYTIIHLLVWLMLALPALEGFVKGDSRFRIMVGTAVFVGAAVKVCSDDIGLLDIAILCAASSRIDFRDIARCFLIVVGASLVLTVALSQLGVIVDYPFSRGSEIRHGLGFSYCTYPSLLFMYLALAYLYLRGAKIRWYEYLVVLAIDVALYVATGSRSPFGLVFVACVVSFLFVRLFNGSAILKGIAFTVRFLPMLIMVISLVLTIAYDSNSSVWNKLNNVTSNRIAQTHASLEKYGVKPFGQYINFKGNALYMGQSGDEALVIEEGADRNYIDNSFMQSLVTKGIITTALCLLLLYAGCAGAYENGDYFGCCLLAIVFLSVSFDPQLLNYLYNVFLFYMWKHAIKMQGIAAATIKRKMS